MVVSWLCFIILYIFSTLHYQKVQNKGKFKHFPKHNLLWLLYFSEASFSLFSVGKLGHIDFANVIYWVNREVGLEPNIQTSPYMFCCLFVFYIKWHCLPERCDLKEIILCFLHSYFNFPKTYLVLSHSVMSDSLRPHGLKPAKLLCPWGFSRQEYWCG